MKIGDKIMVLDDDLNGEIIDISGEKVRVETIDGFEMDFEKSDLVVLNETLTKQDFLPNNISEIIRNKQDVKNVNSKRIAPKKRVLPTFEVDLHIHQLVSSQKGLSNFDMLEIQLDTAKRQLEFAMSKKIQRVVFIHGIGAGVLRYELECLLRKYDRVQFEDANFQKYGRGATEIYISQN